MPLYRWPGSSSPVIVGKRPKPAVTTVTGSLGYSAVNSSGALPYDWSESNLPWAYSSTSEFTSRFPVGTTYVDLQTTSSDFVTNLRNTVNAAGKRVVVRLPAGVFSMFNFTAIGTTDTTSTYAFGFWIPNLQGLVGQGPDKTFVQMEADAFNAGQRAKIESMSGIVGGDGGDPLQAGCIRIDGQSGSPILIAGITFRARDQFIMQQVGQNVPANVPQPAPHQGLVMYNSRYGYVMSHCRFQGFGRAITSSPPFEMGNITSQYGVGTIYNTESDGRLSPAFDAARPRRCTVYMGNNETSQDWVDGWMHHTNISRYAVNDQNGGAVAAQSTHYGLLRTKIEQITNTANTDPVYGELSGYTNACLLGYESTNADITITDCIMSVDNPRVDPSRGTSQHIQFTAVGGVSRDGGKITVRGGSWRNTGFPTLNGYRCFRIAGTNWADNNYADQVFVYNPSGVRMQPAVFGSAWPPTASQLSAAGATPNTHYLVRNG
jgi:hypothetical protein